MNQPDELLLKSTLYAPHINYGAMVDQIQNYLKLSGLSIRIMLFISNHNIFKYFSTPVNSDYKIGIIHETQDILIGESYRSYGRIEKKKLKGRFILYKYERLNLYMLLTHEKSCIFENVLVRYIKSFFPICVMPFFYSWELEKILESLSKALPLSQLMLTKVSKKSRLRRGVSRKEKESDLKWTDLPYKEIFREAKENDEWIEKVEFDLISERITEIGNYPSIILSGSISRNGIFSCEKDFTLLNNTLIEKSVEVFQKRNEQLRNRARSKNDKYESKPIIIEFEEPIFKDKEQNERLVGVLGSFSNSASSIIHKNPYFYAIVRDYSDNSNYDVWVLADNSITVVPQSVCSVYSLNRFIDHLSKEFQEGDIRANN